MTLLDRIADAFGYQPKLDTALQLEAENLDLTPNETLRLGIEAAKAGLTPQNLHTTFAIWATALAGDVVTLEDVRVLREMKIRWIRGQG